MFPGRHLYMAAAAALIAATLGVVGCTVSSQSECTSDDDCAAGEHCLTGGGVLAQDGICVTADAGHDADTGHDADADHDADTGPDPCEDGEVTGQQTDIDCGGPDCPPCENGLNCEVDDDCQSQSCDDGTCQQVVPDPPTDVTAVRDDAGATVRWNPPEFEGDSEIVDYRVTVYDTDGDEASPTDGDSSRLVGDDSTEFLFEDLLNDSTYTFGVEAQNDHGLSEPSQRSNPVMPRPPFITMWDTEHDGFTDDDQIQLPLVEDGDYDFTIHWDDEATEQITEIDDYGLTHTFEEPGTYIVEISGQLEGWRFETFDEEDEPIGNDAEKLELVQQWGVLQPGDGGGAFRGASNLEVAATDTLDLRGTTDMSEAFRQCSELTTIPGIDDWDLSEVTDTSGMFSGTLTDPMPFNQDISDWDTSSVTDFSQMFRQTDSFDRNLSDWDTSSVTDFSQMFERAESFDGDLSDWDTSSAKDFNEMFSWAESFDGDLSDWDTSSATDFSHMFDRAESFDGDLSDWDTSSAEDFSGMFYSASSFNQPVGDWDTSSVTDMSSMFRNAESFNQPVGDWDTSSVEDMSWMFQNASFFDQPVGDWDTSSVTDMNSMFQNASSFDQPVGDWDTSSVEDMSWMFFAAPAFDQNLGDWDITAVTNMSQMFGTLFIGGDPVGLSTVHYDSLLTGWSTQDVEPDVTFDAGNSQYSSGTPANARDTLIDDHDWLIFDDGQAD